MKPLLPALLCALLLPATAAAAATKPDYDALARRVVRNAAISEGEVVFISGQAHDAEFLEDLAVAVRAAGAFPLLEHGSDRLNRRLFFDVPAKYDAQENALGLKLAQLVDVDIILADGLVEDAMAGADPKRVAARGKAGEQVSNAFLEHGVRFVEIGNGFYPTPWRARRYGMSEAALAKAFWDSVATDGAALRARAEKLKSKLSQGEELHITNPNGTDLRVRVAGRRLLDSDGVVSPEELAAGGAAANIYLPAGEVYFAPEPGSAHGLVVHTRDFFRGKEVSNLRLEFRAGKLVSMHGEGPGYADLRASYDAVEDARKDEFSFVDFGLNPSLELPAGSRVGAWVPAGMVSVGMGANTWADGDNTVAWGLTAYLPGSTVTLDDDTVLVERGQPTF
jgi:leucyl aminopeptidase (aminopeptidase T)